MGRDILTVEFDYIGKEVATYAEEVHQATQFYKKQPIFKSFLGEEDCFSSKKVIEEEGTDDFAIKYLVKKMNETKQNKQNKKE